jgi:ABC-type multidrug transport system ATPase subunit
VEEPVIAEGLGLRTRRGWVFHDVDLAVPDPAALAVAGPAGSGRSMLLLALAGRAKPSAGTLTVAGATRRAEIRRRVAVARVTGAVDLDPDLRVADHRHEADLLSPAADHAWAADLVGLRVDGTTVTGDLAPDDAALLSLALAAASRPAALVLDDVDLHTTPAQRRRIWAALTAVADAGITTIASTVDEPEGVAVFRMPGTEEESADAAD